MDRTDTSGAELVGLGMWPGIDGLDLLGPRVTPPDGVCEASPEEIEALRIRAGWPAYGAEIVPGVIPAEVGPWLITAAVSFTKGCYVGQELTTRINSRGGNVPRNLRSIELPAGRTTAVGDDIVVVRENGTAQDGTSDDGAVGAVSSAVLDPRTGTTVALGYVKRSVDDGARLGVPGGDRTD
jgi:folate-binding protein YgfZ